MRPQESVTKKPWQHLVEDFQKAEVQGTVQIVNIDELIQKAKPYTRVRRGRLERVKGYQGRPPVYHGTMVEFAKKMLTEGLIPGGYFKTVFATTDFYSAATYAINDGDFHKDGTNGAMVVVDETSFAKNESGILTTKHKIPPEKIFRVELYHPAELAAYCRKYKKGFEKKGMRFEEDSIPKPKPFKIIKGKTGNCYYVFVTLKDDFQKAEVRVKPFQRRGKLVAAYTRTDPREKHERVSEKAAHDFVDEIKTIAKERNFDVQVVEVEDYGDKTHMEFYLWEKGAEQVMMKRYKEKTPGLMGRLEFSYYHEGGEPQWQKKGYISAVFLKPKFQTGGLGTDCVQRFIDNGVKHGYKRFEMLANGDVGTYVWPIQGFNWQGIESVRMKEDFVKYLEKEHNYLALPKYFPNSWDIASFKIDDEKVGKDWILHEGRTFYEAHLEVGTPGWEIYKHYHEMRAAKKKEEK